ncbi:MAG: DUF58 domain-containing protein [Gemmataceae bacterium]|nr:DUF58 domain-containing protein [Gemmataceae bacterium]MCI0740028.1 DUF58 domain-containing protein [Gemmataceae bacterium]
MADTQPQLLLDPQFLVRLEQLELVSRKIFMGLMKGERRSKRKGQSVEFADYRNYVKGDDLRHLDWNLYARLDRLFVRLFMEEEDLHFYVLIDTSMSMDFGKPSKLHYVKQVAAALAFVGLCNMDRVVIEAFNERLTRSLPAVRGRRSLWRVLDFLNKIEPGGGSNFKESLRTFSLKSSGKGIVVVLSDFFDKNGYEDALRYLVARQFDIYCIQVLAHEEIEPEIVGDLKLVDVEDDDVAEITVSGPLLKRYKQNLASFRATLSEFCTRRGISCLFTDNQVPFDRLVLTYLRQRGLVK